LLGGYFAGRFPPHPVYDGKNAPLRIAEDPVFIALTLHAWIRFTPGIPGCGAFGFLHGGYLNLLEWQ
jgi:hypothetical protein